MIVPSGIGDDQRDDVDRQRAGQQRQDAVVRVREQRRPLRVGEEILDRDVLEERASIRRAGSPTMRERREHGDQPGGEQQRSTTRSRTLR